MSPFRVLHRPERRAFPYTSFDRRSGVRRFPRRLSSSDRRPEFLCRWFSLRRFPRRRPFYRLKPIKSIVRSAEEKLTWSFGTHRRYVFEGLVCWVLIIVLKRWAKRHALYRNHLPVCRRTDWFLFHQRFYWRSLTEICLWHKMISANPMFVRAITSKFPYLPWRKMEKRRDLFMWLISSSSRERTKGEMIHKTVSQWIALL